MKKERSENMESDFLKKRTRETQTKKEEIVDLELPKLEYSELKKLENQLLDAGASYYEWEIPASESRDGKSHRGKDWYVYKTDDTDMTPFVNYIKSKEQISELPTKNKKTKRKSNKEYEKTRRRQIQVKIRTTEEEYRILKEKAEFCQLSLTQYLLKIGIEGYIIIQDLSTLSELANQIYKVGVNINQIAHKVNANDFVMSEDMRNVKEKMEELHNLIYETINKSLGE